MSSRAARCSCARFNTASSTAGTTSASTSPWPGCWTRSAIIPSSRSSSARRDTPPSGSAVACRGTTGGRRTGQPVVTDGLDPILQGNYSSRNELKQTTRELEQKLLTAEKVAAIGGWVGTPTDQEMLWKAWEPALFNQTHDLASGV